MPKSNPLEGMQTVASDDEARAALKQFFGALSPSERRRMWQLFLEIQRSGNRANTAAQ